jgi:hypothetical protein
VYVIHSRLTFAVTSQTRFIAFVVLLISTVGAGWLHGSFTNRWGLRRDASLAADLLQEASLSTVGNWRLHHDVPFTPDVLKMLQCPAHISRVYEHQQTGDRVIVTVIIGPPGPVSVHTPEICYPSRDYKLNGERRKIAVERPERKTDAFWEVPLRSNIDGTVVRVIYGWSSGTYWEAARGPRYSYGALPHLYKLQVAVPVNAVAATTDFDPGQDFLKSFLPHLQPSLVEASR